MIDWPVVLSWLPVLITGSIAYLGWRSGRMKPQVDMSTVAKDAQQIAESALEGQKDLIAGQQKLSTKLETLEAKMTGSYEIKAIVRFYPKPEILEVSMRLVPPSKRGRIADAGQ